MKLFFAVLALSLTVFVSAQSKNIHAVAVELSNEYLPPVADGEEAASAKLADDGYHYKTVRTLKYRSRHKREVSQEYLPPVQEPIQEYLPPTAEKAETKLAEDGYRYKTVRKFKFRSRHRRDVNEIELPSKDNVPLVEAELEPDLRTVVDDKSYRSRHRRETDAAVDTANDEALSKDYLPPVQDVAANEDTAEVKSAELANDGYRYKTVRKIRYRTRH